MSVLHRLRTWTVLAAIGLACSVLLAGSSPLLQDRTDQVRRYTRAIEFDYVSWTTQALGLKLEHFGLGAAAYLDEAARISLVRDYLARIEQAGRLRGELEGTLADPTLADPEAAARQLMIELEQRRAELEAQRPVAEAVLQEQLARVLADWGFGVGGAAWPPVSFRFSRLPVALVVSPRELIRQEANIQLIPELSLDDQIELERAVEAGLDVSALVVPIGGLSTYPTMIMETPALDWLGETIAHEWVHHYLALRPLGMAYGSSAEMRTMNETVAGLVGRELGLEVLRRYYPEALPPPPAPVVDAPLPEPENTPAVFDFRAEMRETRETVDELLAAGQIEQAEQYMEARRQVFWDAGYRHIRRINQAYFAFYGAYADVPGGAAGRDPVGEAVRALWQQIGDPVAFLRQLAWVTSFERLQQLVEA